MKILLVDDNRLLLEGLANLLDAHGLPVAGMAKDGLEAVAMARSLRPDLILMDIRMPRCDGLAATRLVKAEMPEVKIIILTTSTEDQDLFEAVKSGACGYLLKSMDSDELIESLDQAQQGIPPFSPGLAVKLLGEFARLAAGTGGKTEAAMRGNGDTEKGGEGAAQPVRLSERQREVLALVAQGLSYKEVGARLALSPRTIKYHMAEIMELLHLANRAQVLAYAARHGL
jgi:two-component system NarL family response regulator